MSRECTFFMFMLLGGAVVGMWPFGKLSDTIDRRMALLLVLLIVFCSSGGLAVLDASGWLLYLLALTIWRRRSREKK
eukprot:UN12591